MTLNTIPHTSRNTRCFLNISLSHFVSNTNKPKLHESCSTKSKPYSKLQIKTFLCCVVKEKFRHSFVLPKKYNVIEINNFPNRYNLHEFTCNILQSIQLRATQSSWNSQAKTVSTSTNINTLTFLTSHTTVSFSYFWRSRHVSVTIHTQPRSSNNFVQHDQDIMTQHGICKYTDAINYIKLRKRNTSLHEPNTRQVRQIIPAN